MSTSLKIAAAALAAGMAVWAGAPASAAGKTYPHCTRNSVSNIDPATGTNSATLGIRTSVHSDEPNPSGPPVQNNTPANTNVNYMNSNNKGAHQKQDPCAVKTSKRRHR